MFTDRSIEVRSSRAVSHFNGNCWLAILKQVGRKSGTLGFYERAESELPFYKDTFSARCFVYFKLTGNHA